MAKIHIIGGPGSGKTTLAQELAAKLHISYYDLDKIKMEGKRAIELALEAAWITEGIYLIVTEPFLYGADYIVLLEVSWPVAAWRIISRHILNSLRGTQAYPGINGIRLLFKLLIYARRYYLNQDKTAKPSIEPLEDVEKPPTEEFMQKYQEVIIPPSAEFVREYLERYKERVFLVKNRADRERLLEQVTKR